MIFTSSQISDKDNLIILADKTNLSALDAHLSATDATYVKDMVAAKDSAAVIITTPQRFIVVEFIKLKRGTNRNREIVRRAGNDRLGTIKANKAAAVTLINVAEEDFLAQYAEGLSLGNYQFLKYFSKGVEEKLSSLKDIYLYNASEATVAELNVLTDAVYKTRDLVNEPLSYLTAVQLSEEFKAMGAEAGFSVTVLNKAQITELGMGGLLGVNRGSQQPPTFNIMEYKPANASNAKPIVLVGKGVVYDTGGLSLKPTPNSMDYMKCDMAGSALVAGAIYAAAKAKLPLHIVALVPATDNRPGEDAYVPGDVLKMYSGQTVEMLNADAEGRLILADALHYAKQYEPELVMDFATLTGAAAVAIGPQGIVYMGTANEDTKKQIVESSFATHERVVEFPLWDEYGDLIKSDIADMKNIGGPNAGAITAGKFLENFIDYPWLHFDIAGPAFIHAADGYRVKGGTGIGVRLIYDFLKGRS